MTKDIPLQSNLVACEELNHNKNHFGARPKRSAEQALNVLIERIYEVWRGKRTLSLMSFDVQGAFNGVHSSCYGRRLWVKPDVTCARSESAQRAWR
jgi:hypothetical protein